MSISCRNRSGVRALAIALLALPLLGAASAREDGAFPERPDAIVGPSLLHTPAIDATSLCPGFPSEHAAARFLTVTPGDALIELSGPRPGLGPRLAPLLRAALGARLADTDETRREARLALRGLLGDESDPALSRCGWLELARLELAMGLNPEAAAAATRARRLGTADPDAGAARDANESADFLLAEALYLGGSTERTIGAYLALVLSDDPRRAAAARLRLADLRFDHGERADALPDYEVLLERAEVFGADALAWGGRVVEAAIAAGEYEAAQSWLERLGAGTGGAAPGFTIRLADVLVSRQDPGAARSVLAAFESRDAESAHAALARLRLFDWGLEGTSDGEARASLEREIERATLPGIASYARFLLAHRELARPDLDAAMPLLVRVAYDASVPGLAELARVALGETLRTAAAEVTDDAGCPRLIERLADRQYHLLRTASDPEPFQRLGLCYERYRLPLAALELYRSLARRFGARVAGDVALPIARTSLAAGEVTKARAAAELTVASGQARDPGWQRLVADARIAGGEARSAIAPLTEIVVANPNSDAVVPLSQTATPEESDAPARAALHRSLRGVPANRSRAVASLVAADLLRRSGEVGPARALFQNSQQELDGPLRTAARYWSRRLGNVPGPPSDATEDERATPFGRLAEEQAALTRLLDRFEGRTPYNEIAP